MVNANKYKVSKAGSVTVDMTAKADYELVTKKEADVISKQILSTVKPAKKKLKLSENKKLPFEFSDKLNRENVALVEYSTTKKSVAGISKNGTIKGKQAGTAVITATVTLQNGKKKTIKMTVTIQS